MEPQPEDSANDSKQNDNQDFPPPGENEFPPLESQMIDDDMLNIYGPPEERL